MWNNFPVLRSGAIKPRIAGMLLAGALAVSTASSLAFEERAPEPTADYATLAVARDSIGALIQRVVGRSDAPRDTTIQISRSRARFKYWYAGGDSIDAWTTRIVVTDASECPITRIEHALGEAGWSVHPAYIADGPNGAVMGFVSKQHFCLVEGRWEGEDDSDSTYVPTPGCEVVVTCVPRRRDDVPR